jgi:hypothetical protein
MSACAGETKRATNKPVMVHGTRSRIVTRSNQSASERRMQFTALKPYLDILVSAAMGHSFPLYLKSSFQPIQQLQKLINDSLAMSDDQLELHRHDIWMKAFDVEKLLAGELSVQPTYMIFPKRAYDIETLISDGTKLFSDDARQNFSEEEKYDIGQAARCLVFEVPTAAAFHIFRATESVICRYYEVVVGKLPDRKSRNWSVYINKLREQDADPKVVAVLDQIRELYRNPIIHPETQLTQDEALSLIGLAETVISAMIFDLTKRQISAAISLSGGLSALQPS